MYNCSVFEYIDELFHNIMWGAAQPGGGGGLRGEGTTNISPAPDAFSLLPDISTDISVTSKIKSNSLACDLSDN